MAGSRPEFISVAGLADCRRFRFSPMAARIVWFVGLWLSSVLTLAALAFVLRWVLKP